MGFYTINGLIPRVESTVRLCAMIGTKYHDKFGDFKADKFQLGYEGINMLSSTNALGERWYLWQDIGIDFDKWGNIRELEGFALECWTAANASS